MLASAGSLALALSAGSAMAATISSNWAGYAALNKKFRHVQATWVQPKLDCTAGSRAYSAYWVGIGGYSETSQALEQTGTEADCGINGSVTDFAWYELVPAGMVTVGKIKVHGGDLMTASVEVRGDAVKIHLSDNTTHHVFTRTLPMRKPGPDVTSAEWIVEAPSVCNAFGECEVLPLANFGTTNFTDATVTSKSGLTGPINDPAWTTSEIDMESGGRGLGGPHFFGGAVQTGAATGALGAGGDAFAVTFAAASPQTGTTGPTTPTGSGSGNPPAPGFGGVLEP